MPSDMFKKARDRTRQDPTYFHVTGGVQAPSPDTPNLYVTPANTPTREGIYQWIMHKTGKDYGATVQVDDTGHYVLFEASENGRKQMEAYYQVYNDTPMLRKEGHSKWTVQFERRLGVKKVKRTEEEKARRAEKKAKKAAKKESKKRKLEEDAEQVASNKKAKLDETTPASIPPAATSDVESGEIPEKDDLNVEPGKPLAAIENIQLPTPHPTSAVISDPPSSAAWAANIDMGDYNITAFDDDGFVGVDEQLPSHLDHAVSEKPVVDLTKEKDYTPQDLANDQIEEAMSRLDLQKQLKAGDPTAIIINEYFDVYANDANARMGTRSLRVDPLQFIKLLDNKWLTDDVINLYLGFLTDENRQFDMIESSIVALQVRSEANDSRLRFAPTITNVLVPLNPSRNHWALGVADIDNKTFAVYNSIANYSGTQACAEAAVEILHLSGASSTDNRLAGINFKIVHEQAAQQVGSSDCGVWVLANARSIILDKAMPKSIEGFRLHIAKQCLRSLKGETLNFDLDTPPLSPPIVPSNEDDSAGMALEEPSDFNDDAWVPGQRFSLFKKEDFTEKDKILIGLWDKSVSSYLFGNRIDPEHEIDGECHICGATIEDKAEHMAVFHESPFGLCPWPGCFMEVSSPKALETHIKMDHECNVWVCHQKGCYQRFRTKNEAMDHHKRDHVGEGRKPEKFHNPKRMERRDVYVLLKGKRTGVDSGEMKVRRDFYAAWADSRAKKTMEVMGLLNQAPDAELCQTLRKFRTFHRKHKPTERPRWSIKIGEHFKYLWWAVIFFNLPQGPKLDKFIEDTVLRWCEVSHTCHNAPCLTFAELEHVLPQFNSDRTSCKNGVREHRGGCRAVDSLHSHMKPCKLERRRGNFLDDTEKAWDSDAADISDDQETLEETDATDISENGEALEEPDATDISENEEPLEEPHAIDTLKAPKNQEKHSTKTPIECEQCGKVFTFKRNLTAHVKTHLGERPFKCPHCDTSWFRQNDLTRHLLVHSDKRPHACPRCKSRFKAKPELNRHVKRYHGK